MDARNNIATDLFYKIRSRFSGLQLGSETGQITINPEEARFFDFDYMEGEKPIGHVSISLAEPNSMKVYFSHGITEAMDTAQKHNWYGFLKELRFFAKRRLLNFDTRDIAKDNLDRRDYSFLAQYSNPNQQKANTMTKPVGESIMSESNMYGSRTMSYQKLEDTKLIIKHNQAIVDDFAPGARSRNIGALFIENKDGERFKYPFIHLAGARAMQRHVANGGVPYDDIGKSIVKMSEEIAQLKSFGGYVVRNDLMNSDTNGIVERTSEALNRLREQVKALSKQSHYEAYRESFQAQSPMEIPASVIEDYKDKFTVKRFNEELATVFPIIYRLMQEESTLGYDDIVVGEDNVEENDLAEVNTEYDPIAKFEDWVMGLGEDSAITSQDPEEQQAAIQQLQELVGKHFPAGTDGSNAIESLKGIIDDPALQQQIKAAARQDPDTCVRGIVKDWLENNAPDIVDQLDFGDYQEDPAMTGAAPAAQQPAMAGTESIDVKKNLGEADKPAHPYWVDYPKKPEDFGVKPNTWGDKPYPKYQRVQRPGTTKSWEVDYVYDNPEEKDAYDKAQKDYFDQPEYKAYSADREKHYKENEKRKQAYLAKLGVDFEWTIKNPFYTPDEPIISTSGEEEYDEESPEEIDVGVSYSGTWEGSYYAGSREEPPEYPEYVLDELTVYNLDNGQDITDQVSAKDMESIEDHIREKESENGYESVTNENSKGSSIDVQGLAEFVKSFYDAESGTFPKGPEGVSVMVGKKFGPKAESVARKFVERMAPQQTTQHNPELAELARIKELSGL